MRRSVSLILLFVLMAQLKSRTSTSVSRLSSQVVQRFAKTQPRLTIPCLVLDGLTSLTHHAPGMSISSSIAEAANANPFAACHGSKLWRSCTLGLKLTLLYPPLRMLRSLDRLVSDARSRLPDTATFSRHRHGVEPEIVLRDGIAFCCLSVLRFVPHVISNVSCPLCSPVVPSI